MGKKTVLVAAFWSLLLTGCGAVVDNKSQNNASIVINNEDNNTDQVQTAQMKHLMASNFLVCFNGVKYFASYTSGHLVIGRPVISPNSTSVNVERCDGGIKLNEIEY